MTPPSLFLTSSPVLYCKEILHKTRKEIYKREIKYSPTSPPFPLARHRPPSSSQSGMGCLNAPFLIFRQNRPPFASSSLNLDIFLFLRCFHPSFFAMVVHSTLILVFHLPHFLKRWSLVCRLAAALEWTDGFTRLENQKGPSGARPRRQRERRGWTDGPMDRWTGEGYHLGQTKRCNYMPSTKQPCGSENGGTRPRIHHIC